MGKTAEETEKTNNMGVKHPKKMLYRARAHSNPLNDAHFPVPVHPGEVNCYNFNCAKASNSLSTSSPASFWAELYPEVFAKADPANLPQVRFADIGCGFGGLTVRLAPLYPDKLIVGMELRDKVTEYVKERIKALRQEHPGQYQNASAIRTNAMKYLPNYFHKGQLEKIFFLFPDPHFKTANHRRRIIQRTLLAEYAYLLQPGGRLYTITDVEDLGIWMKEKLDAHPLFERISDEELESDPAAGLLYQGTEEGQKVARNEGQTWRAVYVRKAAAAMEAVPQQGENLDSQ